MYIRYKTTTQEDLDIAVVSVGNLTVGGSGKTPLVTAMAQNYPKCAIVLRGYGRKSQGLIVVKDKNNILCDVSMSGDEAMIYAHKLEHAIVIVSEDRKIAIKKAKEMGAEIVFLDDGYSKHSIKKLSFVIDVKTKNKRCLPSGPYRELLWSKKDNIMLSELQDFHRVVELKNKTDKMSLVTAIARPTRLDEFLPVVVSKNYFPDHHFFTKHELEDILEKDKSDSLLVTYKDFVKIEDFDLNLSLLDMQVIVDCKIFEIIDRYKERYSAKKD